jgi:hypothetical protein
LYLPESFKNPKPGKIKDGYTTVREGSKIKQFLEISKQIQNPIFFDCDNVNLRS